VPKAVSSTVPAKTVPLNESYAARMMDLNFVFTAVIGAISPTD
jgi:hypothetical protein